MAVQNPFLNPSPGQDPQASQNPFQSAVDTVLDQMRSDAVNSPQRPDPTPNPFQDPLVSIGMALQGKSAEGIVLGSQIAQEDKRRQDTFNNQVLQAENYRQLRKQRLATTLAGLQAQGERFQIEEQFRVSQAAERKLDRESDIEFRNRQATERKRQDDRMFNLQKAKADQFNSFNSWIDDDDQRRIEHGMFQSFLNSYVFDDVVETPGGPIDLTDPTLTPQQRLQARELAETEVQKYARIIADAGYPEKAAGYLALMNGASDDSRKTEKEVGFDPTDPSVRPEGVIQIAQQREAQQELERAPLAALASTSDIQSVSDMLDFVDTSTEAGRQITETVEAAVAGDRELSASAQRELTRQSLEQSIPEAITENPKHLGTPKGSGEIRRLAKLYVEEILDQEGGAPSTKTIKDNVVQRLMSIGIARAHAERASGVVGQTIGQFLKRRAPTGGRL